MKSNLTKIRELLSGLNTAELAALQQEITEIAPMANEPSPEEKLLPPGHYFEERTDTRGNSVRSYLYERWYERDGLSLKHRGKLIFKGSKNEYIAALADRGERKKGVFAVGA